MIAAGHWFVPEPIPGILDADRFVCQCQRCIFLRDAVDIVGNVVAVMRPDLSSRFGQTAGNAFKGGFRFLQRIKRRHREADPV